ncbi:MAG TPA: TolC family protein, partial [Bacteroidales bacterium]|nr:TolC family protein [Bacteroidales bacterium]
EMSLMANAKFESFRDAKLQVFYEVQKTWYELYKINQNIRISEKNLDILKTLERITLVRYKTVSSANSSPVPQSNTSTTSSSSGGSPGMGSMGGNKGNNTSPAPSGSPMQSPSMGSSSGSTGLTDLYRIQIETGNLENNIALLRSQFITLTAKFNAYLNRPVRTSVSLPDTLVPDKFEVSLLAAEDTMLSRNPMLGMLEYEKQSLEAREKMVTKMGYPMVGLGVNYTLINKNEMSTSPMNGSDMVMPMIKVTLPIYRKKYKAMRTETALMKTATEQNYKAASNALQTEYFETIQAYQDAERRLKLYENQRLLANKSLDIMVRSYASSAGSELTDILSIRQQTLDYEFKLTEALTDYNTAVAQLKRLMSNMEI